MVHLVRVVNIEPEKPTMSKSSTPVELESRVSCLRPPKSMTLDGASIRLVELHDTAELALQDDVKRTALIQLNGTAVPPRTRCGRPVSAPLLIVVRAETSGLVHSRTPFDSASRVLHLERLQLSTRAKLLIVPVTEVAADGITPAAFEAALHARHRTAAALLLQGR
jgi:hypothetical protein